MNCSDIQETLARGLELSPEDAAHATECVACGEIAATYALLDEALGEALGVPEGFADRVMARIDSETARTPAWHERPWASFVVLNAALLVAALNVARFIGGVFVPSYGLAGLR